MSEFKIVGDKYISEWNGNSLNSGTAVSPFAHPADLVASALRNIIGSGYYLGAWTGSKRLIGDGKVLLDLNGGSSPGCTSVTTVAEPFLKNIEIIKCNVLNGYKGPVAAQSGFIIDCDLNIKIYSATYRAYDAFVRCAFTAYEVVTITKEVTASGNDGGAQIYNSLILGNMAVGSNRPAFTNIIYNHCYLDKEFRIYASATDIVNSESFRNALLNGMINFGGTDYELKKLFDGSVRPDANPAIADLIVIIPAIYTNGAFAGDPKFLDVKNKIVASDSDLLKRSNTYGYIGGVRPGKYIPVNSSDSNITITTSNINTLDPVNWLIQSPATEGFINIVWKISDNISEVQRILLDAVLTFKGNDIGGTVGNNNVPDNFPTSYTPLSNAGLKPNRLTYELRTSQSVAKPTLDAQWDNDTATIGSTVAGTFYVQEWNTKPTILTVLGVAYGNGNPAGLGGISNGINARWGHAKIRLTNNRAF